MRPAYLLLLAFALLRGFPAIAQEARCSVPPFRGAFSAAGAHGTMTMANDGRPCSFEQFADVPNRIPYERTEITEAPKNGTVTVSEAPYVRYRPRPGFAGTDHFVLSIQGRDQRGTPHVGVEDMTVTVRP